MDAELILEKIESLRRCVQRVEDKRGDSVENLERDWDRQNIVMVNLTRAVQLCVDIAAHLEHDGAPPDTMVEGFDRLHEMGVLSATLAQRLQGAVGFRNVAVHAYRSVDWQIVHSITHERLDDFRRFARAVLDFVEKQDL